MLHQGCCNSPQPPHRTPAPSHPKMMRCSCLPRSCGAEVQHRPPTSGWCASSFSSCRDAKHTVINLLIPRELFTFLGPHDITHSSSFQCQKLHFKAPLPSERSCCPNALSPPTAICSQHHPAPRFPTMGAGGRLCIQPVTEGCQVEGTRVLAWAGFTYMFLPHLTRTPPTLPPCGKETDQMSPQIRSPFPAKWPHSAHWIKKPWEKQFLTKTIF